MPHVFSGFLFTLVSLCFNLRHQQKPWNRFTNKDNAHLVTSDALDFLSKLLLFDHQVEERARGNWK